jgi:small subunit ribosomal protein S4e
MKKHMKRLRIPAFWKIPKKSAKFATKPRPGPHKKFESIPLLVIVRDIIGISDKGKEAKSIIKMGEVRVDGQPRKDHKYPAGLMDAVSIPKMRANYRIVPTYKGLELIEIDAKDAKKKLCKIEGKMSVRKSKGDTSPKFQLNLHDGRNILIPVAGSEKYTVGDSIVIDPVGNNILDHLEFEEGALAIVVKGKNIGLVGNIEKIIVTKTKEPTKLIFDVSGEKIEVIKEYVFVIGKDEPVMKLTEE